MDSDIFPAPFPSTLSSSKGFVDFSSNGLSDIAAPDCLGIRGIARDLAAAGIGKLKPIKKKRLKQNDKKGLNSYPKALFL